MNTSVINKILTKNTNRDFQIRKPQKTTAEQEQAIREQLHAEIEIKTKACSNIVYDCSLPRIDGYEYCLKHILQDTKSPYKQCTYLYPTNGKRCQLPAPKYDPKKDVFTNFCFEHSRLTQLTKTKKNVGVFKIVESNETLLHGLAHHVNTDEADKPLLVNKITYESDDNDVDVVRPFIDPFTIDHVSRKNDIKNILDYASDSSSDIEMPTVANTWNGHDMECSDNESVDSQNEDLLKHAGIYTTEEATLITRKKMMRLQTLYLEQIQRLQYLLKEKRRTYLQTARGEKETLCSVRDQFKDSFAERQMFDKLRALTKYHRRNGSEEILHRKFIEKRTRLNEGHIQRTSFHTKCIFTEGGVKCGDRVVPCSKHCRKHILEDKKQILFRPCEIEKGGVVCQEPVPKIFEDHTCILHIDIPAQRSYVQKKNDTDSEAEDGDANQSAVASPAVKTEDNSAAISASTSQASIPQIQPLPVVLTKLEHPDDDAFKTLTSSFCDDEDASTNVTICHDETSIEENSLRFDDSDGSNQFISPGTN